jgi:hypothetical protein
MSSDLEPSRPDDSFSDDIKMWIKFQSDGGFGYFPGLSAPVMLDTSTLPPREAESIEALVERARFFELPAQVNAPAPGAADYRTYTITVEDGGRAHTIKATEPLQDPQLQALIGYLASR